MAYPEALVSSHIFHLGWGIASIEGFVILFLSLLKAFFFPLATSIPFFPLTLLAVWLLMQT